MTVPRSGCPGIAARMTTFEVAIASRASVCGRRVGEVVVAVARGRGDGQPPVPARLGQHQRHRYAAEQRRRAAGDGVQDLRQRLAARDLPLDRQQRLDQLPPGLRLLQQHQPVGGLPLPLHPHGPLAAQHPDAAQGQAEPLRQAVSIWRSGLRTARPPGPRPARRAGPSRGRWTRRSSSPRLGTDSVPGVSASASRPLDRCVRAEPPVAAHLLAEDDRAGLGPDHLDGPLDRDGDRRRPRRPTR